jgi:hypothetical protein
MPIELGAKVFAHIDGTVCKFEDVLASASQESLKNVDYNLSTADLVAAAKEKNFVGTAKKYALVQLDNDAHMPRDRDLSMRD